MAGHSADIGPDAPSIIAVLSCCENGFCIGIVGIGIARYLFVKCVIPSVFVPVSYCHHWDIFGTGVMLVNS